MKLGLRIFFVLMCISTVAYCQQEIEIDSTTITFNNPALGFQASLEGILQWPKNKKKCPLIFFIHGSGKGTRYEYYNIFSNLIEKGYAVFGYDKRGINKSTGTYIAVGPKNSAMMIPLLASDAYEGIEVVKKLPQIDSSNIILLGASQAGWIIPVVALMSNAVSHYITLYGPTVSVGEEVYYSRFAENGTLSPEESENLLKSYSGIKGFDPLPYLQRIKQEGLWLYGGKDESIPTRRSIHLLDSLRQISSKRNTLKLYANAGHGLRNYKTGEPEDYMTVIFDWLNKNVTNKNISYSR